MTRLQIVGGGRMGEALIGGILAAGWGEPSDVRIVEASASRRSELEQLFPGALVTTTPSTADGTIVAVKPGDVTSVVADVVSADGGRLLSIAAGVRLDAIEAVSGPEVPVVRAMP